MLPVWKNIRVKEEVPKRGIRVHENRRSSIGFGAGKVAGDAGAGAVASAGGVGVDRVAFGVLSRMLRPTRELTRFRERTGEWPLCDTNSEAF